MNNIASLQSEIVEDILENIDDDGNGSIEYHEFLAHAIGRKQLGKKNLESFFSVILPVEQLTTPENEAYEVASSSSSEGEANQRLFGCGQESPNATGKSCKHFINSTSLANYFRRSARYVDINKIEQMMDEVEVKCTIP